MEIFLVIIAAIFLITGFIGCVLPILPGTPLCYVGLLILHFSGFIIPFPFKFLLVWLIIVIIIQLLDYFIPMWGTKTFGGTKLGVWGSLIGTVAGIFLFPPWGIIAGPFVGAVIGELVSGKQAKQAIKAGLGSFIGFFAGTIIKLAAGGLMIYFFIARIMESV